MSDGGTSEKSLWPAAFVVAAWFLITQFARLIPGIPVLRAIHPILPAAVRMTLMYLVTWGYVRLREKQTFAAGFHFSFQRLGRNILWGVAVAVVATVVLEAYQRGVIVPLTRRTLEASAAAPQAAEAVRPFWARLVEYLYVVYEGIVEVLIFIGFLLHRVARRWKPVWALLATNVVFALWHYAYWRNGLLDGSLMVGLTFIAGCLISLGYLKTKNSLTPVVSHILVDSPSSIRELLGLIV